MAKTNGQIPHDGEVGVAIEMSPSLKVCAPFFSSSDEGGGDKVELFLTPNF